MKGTKVILIAVVAFMLGLVIAPKGETKTIEVEVEKNQAQWVQLKEIDDEALGLCGEFAGEASNAMTAISNMEFEEAQSHTDRIVEIGNEVSDLAASRSAVLEELGY